MTVLELGKGTRKKLSKKKVVTARIKGLRRIDRGAPFLNEGGERGWDPALRRVQKRRRETWGSKKGEKKR